MGRMKRLLGEPERDAELSAALRNIEQAPLHADNDMLRRRIVAAARSRLAALAAPAPHWWELVSSWSRVAVPVGLALAITAVLLMPFGMETSTSAAGADAGDSTLVLAAFSEGSGGQLANLIAPASHDWLLEQAISR
jgi:hypothetical protein